MMSARVSSSDAFCTFTFFDCLTTKEEVQNSYETRHADNGTSLRETQVHYQQPHLVEPMRLTVYEDLPTTPLSAVASRSFFSRRSSRASFFSLRKRMSKQTPSPFISSTMIQANHSTALPLRRRREFRPLELSIYVEKNRLSDLPAFDRLSFTEFGELKNIAEVLHRPQSAVLPPSHYTPLMAWENVPKPTSMYEISATTVKRPETSYSVISMSRPPSEYDALHSHPVSWASLPGLSIATQGHKVEKPVAVLTPMQEEFPSESTLITVDETVLTFPSDGSGSRLSTIGMDRKSTELAAPAPVVSRCRTYSIYASKPTEDQPDTLSEHTRPQSRQSISQWLPARQRTSSASTVGSSETTTSFIEHHRKRSEFYRLGQEPQMSISLPPSHQRSSHSMTRPYHRRTVTGSTIASTINTDILSLDDPSQASADSWTIASDVHSRSGTIKSIPSPGGRKVITSTVNEFGILIPQRGQVAVVDEEMPYLDDIRGRLRTPGIGVAF